MRTAAPVLALFLALAACSASPEPSDFKEKKPDTTGGFGDGSSGSIGGEPTPTTTNQAGCSDAAKLVYVVSDANDLYSFTPDKASFTKIGQLNCAAPGATPNSMAVDRTGVAWVNYSDGGLFKVSTADASCTPTGYEKGQGGLTRIGMAFATNSATSEEETLFVVGIVGVFGGKGLAKIDLKTMKLTSLGDFSGALKGQGAELTGTGDGRLFGFFTTQPDATLAQISKGDGATTGDASLDGVSTGNAWAFSFWGGDFWFYTAVTGAGSTVTRKQTSGDGSLSTVKQDVGGFRIVGAGVSTCAPTTPPAPR